MKVPQTKMKDSLVRKTNKRIDKLHGEQASKLHTARVKQELRDVGLSNIALESMETTYLPKIINSEEHIKGAVFGLQDSSFVMLIATDWRIIFLDRKPMFTSQDEVNYGVVNGVSLSYGGIGTTVTLHTRIKDFHVVTLNPKTAHGFVDYVEARSMETKKREVI